MNDSAHRSLGELQRAARRHARMTATQAPWLVPLLVVSDAAEVQAWREQLDDRPGLRGDPHFAHVCHTFGRGGDSAALAERIAALLSQDLLHAPGRPWRWPARRGLVLVTVPATLDLVRQALPTCERDAVLAVYVYGEATVQCLGGPSLPAHTLAEAGAAIRRDIGQRLLRDPPTPFGQALNERVATP